MSRALYKTLIDDLLKKIADGELQVGERLPPESEFAEQLGVSRSTLRQAFSQLEQSGILKRRKRGGTEIIASRPVKRFNLLTKSFYDVLTVARDTLLVVTDLNKISDDANEDLADYDSPIDEWLVCNGDRYMAGQLDPFATLTIHVPNHYSDIDLHIGDTVASVLVKIQERYDVVPGGVKRRISAALCTEEVSQKIGINIGAPVLSICTEISDDKGELIEIAFSIIDPERFVVTTNAVAGA